MIFYLRYVPHDAVAAYRALGWEDCGPTMGHHGVHSRMMRWNGGQPIEPEHAHA